MIFRHNARRDELARRILAALDAYDKKLDDPTGDGKGTDSRPPEGDDYNAINNEIRRILAE